jgi:hypothetical protein
LRASGSPTYTLGDAAIARAKTAADMMAEKNQTNLPSTVQAYGGAWSAQGPNPILQIDRTRLETFMP